VSEVEITPTLHHVEVYTLTGLLTLLWHGPRDTERVVITGGGGMGSLLGPADGIYHYLGEQFARDDIATIRVGYRSPTIFRCVCTTSPRRAISRCRVALGASSPWVTASVARSRFRPRSRSARWRAAW